MENHYLGKRYTELKVEYQTQENDRQMLLKEVVLQKNRKELLNRKIEYYKKCVQQSMVDANDQDDDDSVDMDSKEPERAWGPKFFLH